VSGPVRILMFGATGQLAREILVRAGSHAITALGRGDVDLADADAVEAAVASTDANLVINAAAYTAVDRAESEEELAFAINARAPGSMAMACAAQGLPLVHISTDYVFNGEKAGAWSEDDPIAPLNAYGRSKAAGEAAILATSVRALILRTSWVFSSHGSNFVKTMLRAAETRAELRVVDDQRGRPTAAGDLAAFILDSAPRLIDGNQALFGVFHFAGAGVTTWRSFAEAIFAESHGPKPRIVPISTADYPTPARRPRNSALDCAKLAQVFGVSPRPWRDGLIETLNALSAGQSRGVHA
jgi:dTDP-4-dehydrorhamnose reductase